MDKDVFKDWTLGDYLLKAGPPKPLIPRVGNNDKRVIKGRPLHVAPPAHRQPLRIFLAPDLEPFKYEAYKDLVYAAAARSGVELQGPRTSLNFMASFEMRGLGISESIECVVVSPVHTIAIVALGFAHEIASDFAPAPDFASPESSRRNWWPSFDGLVEEGDFNIGLMTSDRSVRGEEWNMVAPIEVLTMFAADRSFAKLEEEIAAGGEDGVRILDITGAGRELLYRVSCLQLSIRMLGADLSRVNRPFSPASPRQLRTMRILQMLLDGSVSISTCSRLPRRPTLTLLSSSSSRPCRLSRRGSPPLSPPWPTRTL